MLAYRLQDEYDLLKNLNECFATSLGAPTRHCHGQQGIGAWDRMHEEEVVTTGLETGGTIRNVRCNSRAWPVKTALPVLQGGRGTGVAVT